MDELAVRLRELVQQLEGEGSTFWSQWMRKSLTLVEAQNYSGVEYFLQAFGGMGSFNDGASPESLALATPAYTLARRLLRERTAGDQLHQFWFSAGLRTRLLVLTGMASLVVLLLECFRRAYA